MPGVIFEQVRLILLVITYPTVKMEPNGSSPRSQAAPYDSVLGHGN